MVNVYIATSMERSTMLLMGKSTISTGPFSMSQTVSLPEGNKGGHDLGMVNMTVDMFHRI